MGTVLIAGAASGIGRAWVQEIFHRDQVHNVKTIYALDNTFSTEQEPTSIFNVPQNAVPTIKLLKTDVTNEHDVSQVCHQIQDESRSTGATIDIVIYSVGVRGLDPAVPILQSSDVARAETLSSISVETLERTLRINSIGTFILLRALTPLLNKASGSPAKVLIMSSRMGSVGHNTVGGAYAYRASKAAQNALVRSLAADVPEVIWVLVHPGRVETRLVAVKEDGAMTPAESVEDMTQLLMNVGREQSGHFMDRFGEPIPW